MKHVDPKDIAIAGRRDSRERIALAGASDHRWKARFLRDRARHLLRTGDRLGHRWTMQNAIKAWREAARYYRETRNV